MQDEVIVRIMCSQGRHRSVSLATALAVYLHCMGLPVYIYFRGLDRARYEDCRPPMRLPHALPEQGARHHPGPERIRP